MDFTLIIIFLQRIIELLALYLILANINGKDLKIAFAGLFVSSQRILYENIMVFLGYGVVTASVCYLFGVIGYTVILVSQPFAGLFFIKRTDLKLALLATISMAVFGGIVALFNVFITLHALPNFILTLLLVTLVVYRNYHHRMFVYLTTRKILLNIVCLVSFFFYIAPLLFDINVGNTVMVAVSLILLYTLTKYSVTKGMKKELSEKIELISNSSFDKVISMLESLADESSQSNMIQQFIINGKSPSKEFIEALTDALEVHVASNHIKTYDCKTTQRQIKISILL